MSQLEDEIRDTLRSEADRLREVRPLHLPAVAAREPQDMPGHMSGPRRAWLRAWYAPAAAVAAVVLVAAALVTLRSLGTGHTSAPGAGPSPGTLAADSVPRYHVEFRFSFGSAARYSGPHIVVGDEQEGKTIATVPLLPKGRYKQVSMTDTTVTGAADDRTFVMSTSVYANQHLALPLTWYLVRIMPGSAHPVRVTRLPIEFPASPAADSRSGWHAVTTALSDDGTELAVVSADDTPSSKVGEPIRLQVYSVTTGRLQRSWSAGIDQTQANLFPINDLTWVGDNTLGFAVTYTPEVREQVRTLDVGASGPSLLADSRAVWSQYVPPSQLTHEEKATIAAIYPPPHACDTPFLTGNGQAVVCGNAVYSAGAKRLSAVWLAYPIATPTQPRVLGSVQEPQNVTAFNGSIEVDWTNPAGTEIIGSWNPTVITGPSNNPTSTVTNYEGYIGNGTVKTFPYILGAVQLAW